MLPGWLTSLVTTTLSISSIKPSGDVVCAMISSSIIGGEQIRLSEATGNFEKG